MDHLKLTFTEILGISLENANSSALYEKPSYVNIPSEIHDCFVYGNSQAYKT